MAHRANIGVLELDGSSERVHCHHGSGPDWGGQNLGCVLAQHHNSEASARAIVALGHLSQLGRTLDFFMGDGNRRDLPHIDATAAYHRDAGKGYVAGLPDVETYKSESYDQLGLSGDIEFLYMFDVKSQCWLYGARTGGFSILELRELPRSCYGEVVR